MRRIGLILATAACCAWAASSGSDLRLLDAVKRRDVKAFESLLKQVPDINATAPDGATALSWAIFLDLSDMAVKLLAAGANVNTATEYGETPLTLALANGNADLTGQLLKAGADPKVTRWNGETPLMIAAGAGNIDEVRMLLDRGVDVNGTDPKKKQSALMWAASEGHTGVVDLLIQKGADVNAAGAGGFTPLVFASLKNDGVSVRLMLKAGANPNYTLPDQTKVLTAATQNKCTAAALELLDGGADPNIADKTGNTPLHVAAQNGALDLVQKLLAKKANLNVKNAQARATGFRAAAGEQTPLMLAARNNRVAIMRALIEAGADTKLKGQDGGSLLLVAAASGRVQAVKYSYEFDKDVKAVDATNRTAMHLSVTPGNGAAMGEMTELVDYLASIGVPMDEKDQRGRTPIQTGDVIPYDKPIQRMAEIIISRGGTPIAFPKEYIKPAAAK